jgi:hypothetical protein
MFVSQNALLSSSSLDFSHFSVPTLRLPALSALDFKHSSPRTFQLINWSFRTSSHQYHPMGLTLPLFSCSTHSLVAGKMLSTFFSVSSALFGKNTRAGGTPFNARTYPVLPSTQSLLELALTNKPWCRGPIVPVGSGGTANPGCPLSGFTRHGSRVTDHESAITNPQSRTRLSFFHQSRVTSHESLSPVESALPKHRT